MSATETQTRMPSAVLVDPDDESAGQLAQRVAAPAPHQPSPKDVTPPKADLAAIRSESIDELVLALAKSQLEFDAIVKNKSAEVTTKREGARSYTYGYADLAAVLEVVRPVLGENGIAIIQLPNSSNGTVTVSTILAHRSGQFIRNNLSLSCSNGDPQALGSAITYLRRYALQSMLGVAPSEEDDDGQAASGTKPPPPPQPAPRRSQRATEQAPQAPVAAEKVATVTPAPAPTPAKAPVAPTPVAQPKTTGSERKVGIIAKIEPRGATAILVTFEDGFTASCSRAKLPEVVETLERVFKNGDVADVSCVPSSDPTLYAPRIVEASQQVTRREPGEEG